MTGVADPTHGGGYPSGAQPATSATTGPYLIVLVRAVSQKWTGTVVSHTDEGLTHYSYFLEGAPCKVRPGALVAPLDSILLRLGGIEPHALANAVSTACERPDLLLGEILIQRGLLAPELLYSALRWQLLERLNYLMTDGVAGGRHEMHDRVDLIPLSSQADLHPADPMYCIMCASRLPACESVAQRYVARVREMRLGLNGGVDTARFGLTAEEQNVVHHLASGAYAFDELVALGLPQAVVQRVVFALGVTQALASKGRFQNRMATVPAPPPSLPPSAVSGGPPVSAAVPAGMGADADVAPASTTAPGDGPGGRPRAKSVGRLQLKQRAVRRSSMPSPMSQPPSQRTGTQPLDSMGPAHSMPPPDAYGAAVGGSSSAPAPFIPAPTAPRRRRGRPSPTRPPVTHSVLPPPAGAVIATVPPEPKLTAPPPAEPADPPPVEPPPVEPPPVEPPPADAPPAEAPPLEPPPPRMNPMLSEPFGHDHVVPENVKAVLDARAGITAETPVALGFDDPAELYDREPESTRSAIQALEPPPVVEAVAASSPEPEPASAEPAHDVAPQSAHEAALANLERGVYEQSAHEAALAYAEQGAYEEPVPDSARVHGAGYGEPAYEAGPEYAEPAYDAPEYAEPAYEAGPQHAEPAYDAPEYAEPAHEAGPEYAEPAYDDAGPAPSSEEYDDVVEGGATQVEDVPPFAEGADVVDEPRAESIASQPVRKRGMSLSERRAYEAQVAADAAMRILDFKAADGHLQRALRFAPKNADLMAKAAYVQAMNKGRRPAGDKEFYDAELELLRDVIQDDPRCEAAHYLRGRLLMRLMRRDEAVRDFEKAVRINPDNVDAAREIREAEARKAKKRKRQPTPEPTSSFRGVLNWLGIDKD